MTKLFLIAALMTLSLAALAVENENGDTANENCDVSVVPTGGEPDGGSSTNGTQDGAGAPR